MSKPKVEDNAKYRELQEKVKRLEEELVEKDETFEKKLRALRQ